MNRGKVFWVIEPEVSGSLGEGTIIDSSVHPPIISMLNYEFSGWLKNDLVESFPCFLVTENLKNCIDEMNFSGVCFDEVHVTKSDEFTTFHPNFEIPKFFWMKITGLASEHDFGLSNDYRLVVSSDVLNTFKHFNISEADIEKY